MRHESATLVRDLHFRRRRRFDPGHGNHDVADVAGRIACPMLITEPANEAFWPGQSQKLYAMLTGPKTMAAFAASDGADLHCEPGAYGLRDLRIFNWLDEVLARA